MKKILLVIIGFICINLHSIELKVNYVKKTGDNRDNYIFFKITSAVITPDKNIFVCDSKSHFISKYNWDGKFVKRVGGKKGKGPMDFNYIPSIKYCNNKLYIYDMNLLRITETDLKLNPIKYYHFGILENNIIIYNNKFIGNKRTMFNKKGRIFIMDFKGKVIKSFFSRSQFGELQKPKNKLDWALKARTSRIVFDFNKQKRNFFVGFEYPLNPMVFYILNYNGKIIKKINFKMEKKYEFPHFLNKFPLKSPKKRIYYAKVLSVFSYKNFWIVSVGCNSESKEGYRFEGLKFILFDNNGKLLDTLTLNEKISFFNITQDGYLIGTKEDSDIPQVLIYKLNISN